MSFQKRNGKLANINIFPIKSTAGISFSTIEIEHYGLRFDRRLMLVDLDGQIIEARRYAKLLSLKCTPFENGLTIETSPETSLEFDYIHFAETEKISLWGRTVSAVTVSHAANEWFSKYLSTPCRLVSVPSDLSAHSEINEETGVETTSFTDRKHVLIVTQNALSQLNERLGEVLSMDRFRPNLVISDAPAHAEDTWQYIKIGNVNFEVVEPCERCILTTIDPSTLERHPRNQPIRELISYRRNSKGRVTFGAYAIPRNVGQISVGDPIHTLDKC